MENSSLKSCGEIEQAIRNLPLFSANVIGILALLDDAESSFDDIVARLAPDVTAKFLAMANSAFYGRPVSSIGYAVRVLGFEAMRRGLVASLLLDFFETAARGTEFDQAKFQSQSQLVALVGKTLAELTGFERPADLVTAGLLHNIGKMVIAVSFPEQHEAIRRLKKTEGLSSAVAEQRLFGCGHAEISAILLRKFNIPDDLCDAVRYHERHDRAISCAEPRLQLECLLREAAGVVDRCRLPTAGLPPDLGEKLHKIVGPGKMEIQERLRREMLADGEPHVFQMRLLLAVELIEAELAQLFESRQV